MSRWLETRTGHCVMYSLVSIAPVGAVILAFANCTEEAVIMISAGILVLAISVMITFWVCGRSLMHGIDESLRQQQKQREQLLHMGAIRVNGKEVSTSPQDRRSSGDAMLLAARKKVKTVVIFAVGILSKVVGMLIFAMASPYGLETPLVLFLSPMTLVPPVWNIVNVTIHRGRTKLSSSSGVVAGSEQSRVKSSPASYVFVRHYSRRHKVVATAESTTS